MKIRYVLLAAVAASSVMAGEASAATHKQHRRAAASAGPSLSAEVRALRAEIATLRSEVAEQKAAQATVVTQVETAQSTAQASQAQIQAVQAQVAAVQPVTAGQVHEQIATAIDKEHHNDQFYFKGLTIKPGGFLELGGIYRGNFQGNDMASSFAIPFPNNRAAHASEGRFSARQSRLSFLAEGKVNPNVTLGMYGEFDFLGGAQTANSNESNSYNPRIRNLYGTIDWNKGDHGFHLLAGQNWSLVTMNSKGITPRNELMPPQIDAQYIPGFVWARQPQVRLTADFLDHKLWLAFSAENPATQTPAGTIPGNVTFNQAAGSGFDAANNLSLNSVPDFVGKVAYEGEVGGRTLHVEGFALYRDFVAHLNNTDANNHEHGYGFGGGVNFQLVPKVVDVQVSGMIGKGIGRYGTSGLPDVTFGADGSIHSVNEFMLLAGATVHATKRLDLYLFAGEEQEEANNLGGGFGIGLITANNAGCFVEGGTCAGNTHRIRQITTGFWDKFYQGQYGRAQVGIQYSYTQRELFDGIGGAPQADQNMAFLSFRYYPF